MSAFTLQQQVRNYRMSPVMYVRNRELIGIPWEIIVTIYREDGSVK